MEHYRHTQVGVATILAVVAGMALFLGMSQAIPQAKLPLLLGSGILLVCLVLFSTLTVVVSDREMLFWFGVGLVRKRTYLTEVKECEPVKNSWVWGWGIHMTPRGWLYNVSGFWAVEVTLSSGSRFRLGTDEPDELCRAIRAAAHLPSQESGR